MRTATLAAALFLGVACSSPEPPGDLPAPAEPPADPAESAEPAAPAARPSGFAGPSAFPREAVLSPSSSATSIASADPAALREIIAAASDPPPPTAEDGGTKLGTDTRRPPDPPAPRVEPPEPPKPRVSAGAIQVQTEMSTPAIEKTARAQLYWLLVQRCRDAEGKLLPPDAITLSFTIDPEGYIVPSSIVSTPADPKHEDAAACMRKELAGAPFRTPPASRGLVTRVDALVPSVD